MLTYSAYTTNYLASLYELLRATYYLELPRTAYPEAQPVLYGFFCYICPHRAGILCDQ